MIINIKGLLTFVLNHILGDKMTKNMRSIWIHHYLVKLKKEGSLKKRNLRKAGSFR